MQGGYDRLTFYSVYAIILNMIEVSKQKDSKRPEMKIEPDESKVYSVLDAAEDTHNKIKYAEARAAEAERRASYDPLTSAYTRGGLETNFQDFVESLPPGKKISVTAADLDGLKEINACHDHYGGDLALRMFAYLMTEIRSNSKLVRLGGDEFQTISIVDDDSKEENYAELLKLDVQRAIEPNDKGEYKIQVIDMLRKLEIPLDDTTTQVLSMLSFSAGTKFTNAGDLKRDPDSIWDVMRQADALQVEDKKYDLYDLDIQSKLRQRRK